MRRHFVYGKAVAEIVLLRLFVCLEHMPKVTSLKRQIKNKSRVSVFLDGEFAFGLPEIVAAELRIDQELSQEQLDDLLGRATIEAAKQSAIRFISYRPRSSAEVRRNLTKKAFEPEVIELVIEWLPTVHLLDDHEFARYWIEQREAFKPRSRRALSMELGQKGIAREIIDELLGEIDEFESAQRAARKRLGRWEDLPEDEFRLKLYRYLQGRGFGYGVAREVGDALWEELTEQRERDEES